MNARTTGSIGMRGLRPPGHSREAVRPAPSEQMNLGFVLRFPLLVMPCRSVNGGGDARQAREGPCSTQARGVRRDGQAGSLRDLKAFALFMRRRPFSLRKGSRLLPCPLFAPESDEARNPNDERNPKHEAPIIIKRTPACAHVPFWSFSHSCFFRHSDFVLRPRASSLALHGSMLEQEFLAVEDGPADVFERLAAVGRAGDVGF